MVSDLRSNEATGVSVNKRMVDLPYNHTFSVISKSWKGDDTKTTTKHPGTVNASLDFEVQFFCISDQCLMPVKLSIYLFNSIALVLQKFYACFEDRLTVDGSHPGTPQHGD